MITLPELYPHQSDHKNRVRAALKSRRSVILQAEPGVGKTRMSKWILGSYQNTGSGHALFAVYGRGLVDNATKSFSESPELPHAVLMSGRDCNPVFRVQVASIDTMLSWFCEGGEYSWDMTFDLIVYDEAHAHHTKFARFLAAHLAKRTELGLSPPFVIGLTATPEAKGLADVYREIVRGKSPEWLIANGFLKPYRYFHATDGDLGKLVKRGDTFTEASISAAMDGMSGDLVRDWTIEEHNYLRHEVPRKGLRTDFRGRPLSELAERVLDISAQGLRRRAIFDSVGDDESSFLRTIQKIAKRGYSPSEELLNLYEKDWGGNVDPIYREFAY